MTVAAPETHALEERCAYLEGLVRDAYDALTREDLDWHEHEVICGRLRAELAGRRD